MAAIAASSLRVFLGAVEISSMVRSFQLRAEAGAVVVTDLTLYAMPEVVRTPEGGMIVVFPLPSGVAVGPVIGSDGIPLRAILLRADDEG